MDTVSHIQRALHEQFSPLTELHGGELPAGYRAAAKDAPDPVRDACSEQAEASSAFFTAQQCSERHHCRDEGGEADARSDDAAAAGLALKS